MNRPRRDRRILSEDVKKFIGECETLKFEKPHRKILDELIDKEGDPDDDFDARQRKLRAEEGETCGICLVPFEQDDELTVLPCPQVQASPAKSTNKLEESKDEEEAVQHMFHGECISEWFEKKRECPLCRHNFEPDVREIAKARLGLADDEPFEEQKSQDDIENRRRRPGPSLSLRYRL